MMNISVNGGNRHNSAVREGAQGLVTEAKAAYASKRLDSKKNIETASREIARDIVNKAKERKFFI